MKTYLRPLRRVEALVAALVVSAATVTSVNLVTAGPALAGPNVSASTAVTQGTPTSCGTVLRPDVNPNVQNAPGQRLADDPRIRAKLERGFRWAAPGEVNCNVKRVPVDDHRLQLAPSGSKSRPSIEPASAAAPADAKGVSRQTSYNWSGWARRESTANYAWMLYYAPHDVVGSAGDTVSEWTGLGGTDSGSLLVQAGIQTTMTKTTTTPTANTFTTKLFWEIVPGYVAQIRADTTGTVPGDPIEVEVEYNKGVATFNWFNDRTGTGVTITHSSSDPGPSIECINERSARGTTTPATYYPLANFMGSQIDYCGWAPDLNHTTNDIVDHAGSIVYDTVQGSAKYMYSSAGVPQCSQNLNQKGVESSATCYFTYWNHR